MSRRTSGNNKNDSPPKITDVQIDITPQTPIVTNSVDDIIADVIKSTTTEPSMPTVVLDTIDTVIDEQMNEEMEDDGKVDTKPGETEEHKKSMSARQSSVSEIINSLEKMKDSKDDTDRRSVSPKQGSVSLEGRRAYSSVEGIEAVQKVSEDRDDTNVSVNTVTVTSVKTDSKLGELKAKSSERALEIQTVKVKIYADEDRGSIASSNIDDVITINGQPVLAAGTVVLNRHITTVDNRAAGKTDNNRRDQSDYVPQTDLDTLETKISNGMGPSDVSNPDDDSSNQRSDNGSINTVNSIDKEEGKESPKTKQRNFKARNVVLQDIAEVPISLNNGQESLLTLFTTWTQDSEKFIVHNLTLMNWKSLGPGISPVLFTNDTSVEKDARKSGWQVFPISKAAAGGVPVLKYMYKDVMKAFNTTFYAYSNGDILFTDSLIKTLTSIKYSGVDLANPVLIVGKRTNVDNVTFAEGANLENITAMAKSRGTLFTEAAEDFFITSGAYPWRDTAEVVIGRRAYDNWLVVNARKLKHTVIDATKTLLAVHQTTKAGNSEGHEHKNGEYNHNLLVKLYRRIRYGAGVVKCCEKFTKYENDAIKIANRIVFNVHNRGCAV